MSPTKPKTDARVDAITRRFCFFFALFVSFSLPGASSPSTKNATDQSALRFEQEIQAFAAADRAKPPVPGGTLFVGSSIFRRWTSPPSAT